MPACVGVCAQAGWGAPVDFKPAKLVKNSKAATELHTIVLDVGTEIGAGYTKPGQFIQVKVRCALPWHMACGRAAATMHMPRCRRSARCAHSVW